MYKRLLKICASKKVCKFFRCLQSTPGFKFTARPRSALPDGFPESIPGVGYFLEEYKPLLNIKSLTKDETRSNAKETAI